MPQIYKVGGCVRDAILGIESKDIDFTFVLDDISGDVSAGFQSMDKWMRDQGYEIFLAKEDCYTIRARFPKDHANSGMTADFVMARKEVGYYPETRQPILELGTLYDDLVRRDFTLNAMAEAEDGTIIDNFDGCKDLKRGILRTPRDPEKTMLDDPLRFIRALRFSITKGFEIDPAIFKAVSSNAEILEKLEKVVSAERIREELHKMMKHNTPAAMELLVKTNERFSITIGKDRFMKILFRPSSGESDQPLWFKPTFKE